MDSDLVAICNRKIPAYEGKMPNVYLDSKGILTWGIGRNVRQKGLSTQEIMNLFPDNYKSNESSYLKKYYTAYKNDLCQWEIGINCDLQHRKLSNSEMLMLFENDLNEVFEQLSGFDWYNQLNNPRKYVLTDMCFNLGLTRLLRFTNFIEFLKQNKYLSASSEMLNSVWADQVKKRAIDLSKIMAAGAV